MSQHFMTVCVLCVLCAAHTRCTAHTSNTPTSANLMIDNIASPSATKESIKTLNHMKYNQKMILSLEQDNVEHLDSVYGSLNKQNNELNTDRNGGKRKIKKNFNTEKLRNKLDNDDDKIVSININPMESPEVLERLGQIDTINLRDNSQIQSKYNYKQDKLERRRAKRHADVEERYFLKKIFDAYGDGTSLTIDGFEMMLKKLGLVKLITNIQMQSTINNTINNETIVESQRIKKVTPVDADRIDSKQKCLSQKEFLTSVLTDENLSTSTNNQTIIPGWLFERVCPVLLYHLASNSSLERNGCVLFPDNYKDISSMDEFIEEDDTRNMVQVWVYSTISIVIISLCGLLGVAVIPVMGKSYYHQLLQFLVALAIGTLCGDALIHLLPH
ncbi:hypothetical protein PV328_011903, partial [Microctonus aethiopoides]